MVRTETSVLLRGASFGMSDNHDYHDYVHLIIHNHDVGEFHYHHDDYDNTI